MTATKPDRDSFIRRTSPWEGSLAARAREQSRDAARLRWALGTAAFAHAVLLLVQLPELYASTPQAAEDSRRVYVLEEPRFKPPVRDPEPQMPQRRAVRVPMPDPTPDGPEPLVREQELPLAIEIDDLGAFPDIAPPPPPASRPRRVTGAVRPPVRLSGRQPLYTELARRVRREGVVILDAVIDTEGRVTEVEILRGLGLGLDEEVVDAVSSWRFRPATLGGQPLAVVYTLTVRFELR